MEMFYILLFLGYRMWGRKSIQNLLYRYKSKIKCVRRYYTKKG